MLVSHAFSRQCLKLPSGHARRALASTIANGHLQSNCRPRKIDIVPPVQTSQPERGLFSWILAPFKASKKESRIKPSTKPTKVSKSTRRAKAKDAKDVQTASVTSPLEIEYPSTTSAVKPKRTRRAKKSDSAVDGEEATTTTAKPRRKRRAAAETKSLPPRVSLATTQKHHDLATFLQYASQADLKTTSTVYRGTHYEYRTAETLKAYNFTLYRTGRANDLGIDLIGEWMLPQEPRLRVLIQCKASAPKPAMIRELEGAYIGAPSGWRDEEVMAFLITSKPATKGVREALQRSRLPMGFMQISPEGVVQQFLWNNVAQQLRLTGMTATNMYKVPESTLAKEVNASTSGVQGAISLLWMGKQWKGTILET